MSVKELVKKRADLYKNSLTNKKAIMRLAGDIVVRVMVMDSNEKFSILINKDGYEFIEYDQNNPTVTIEGKEETLIELINTLSSDKYQEAEKKGNIKVQSHGIKGRLVVSKVKKMFGMN